MEPSLSDVTELLETAELTARGFLAGASNHTLLVRVGEPALGVHAVYKPQRGERPLWDFPTGTLYQREAAAFAVSAWLGWDLVPPTVVREGPFGVGSVQLFVPHDPQLHYFVVVDDDRYARPLAQLAYFDLLVNNADRKGSHIILADDSAALLGIDHGLTFNAHPKLRTVVWDLGAARLDAAWRADMGRLADALGDKRAAITGELRALLSADELLALQRRAQTLRDLDCLPEVPDDRRPYPWPPL